MKLQCIYIVVTAWSFAGSAYAERVSLSDLELDNVAAGFYSTSTSTNDAVVVGNGAVGNINTTPTVTLVDRAQAQAKVAALVNGANSSVANATNVWQQTTAAQYMAADSVARQMNVVQQTGAAGASLDEWHSGARSVTTHTSSLATAFSGGITPDTLTVSGLNDTAINVSRGIALSGSAQVEFGGFGIGFNETYDTVITTSTKKTVTVKFLWWSNKVTTSSSSKTEEKGQGGNTYNWVPDSASFTGVGCVILVGTCQYHGRYIASLHTVDDVLQPASVKSASADRIVLSDGTLTDKSNSTVKLENQSQIGISAVHTVNAAGSQLANGLNVASQIPVASVPHTMQLQQSNLFVQRQ